MASITSHSSGRWTRRSFVAAGLALAATGSQTALAATPGANAWNELLRRSVNSEGWVNYQLLKGPLASKLSAHLDSIAKANVAALGSPADKMAFWINAYNALCIQLLIDAGLPSEVPHSKLFGKNIFTEERYRIAGKVRSLDDIEHGILRKRYPDPRIHAAVVCGASSCPRLRPEAYQGDRLSAQLNEECQRWVRSGKTKSRKPKNHLHKKSKTYYASKIFDWYEEDFGDSDAGILKFIMRYADESDRKFMAKHEIDLEFLDYEWAINSA